MSFLCFFASMPRRGLEPPRDINPTSTSSWRVCQFRHLGLLQGRRNEVAKYRAVVSPVEDVR